ncbi:MAG: ArdC-like ssDNA-binding domain-containing protein [Mycobacteriales bacterium]
MTGSGRGDRLTEAHQRLQAALAGLTESDAWQRMLTVAARFHSYSPNNILLIGVQRPDATRVAGYRRWVELGRHVRKGEKGIGILAPVSYRADPADPDIDPADDVTRPRVLRGFRVVHVFDISQTDGAELPELRPRLITGEAPVGLWDELALQVAGAGFSLRRADTRPANGYTDHAARVVAVHDALSEGHAVKTLAHELGHCLLHGPLAAPEGLTREQAEVEAESVAYVVTAAAGLDSIGYTLPYVAGWAGGNCELVRRSAERVLGCSRAILDGLHQTQPTPVEPAEHTLDRSVTREPARLRAVG